jgi:hypothetical protein
MKLWATLLSLLLLMPFAQAQSPKTRRAPNAVPETGALQTKQSQLPIRRVVLYSNGVAYFERRGQVAGDKDTAETKLLIARYVAKAGEQETRLEQLAAEKRAATGEAKKLQDDLSAAIRALNVDHKLEGQ